MSTFARFFLPTTRSTPYSQTISWNRFSRLRRWQSSASSKSGNAAGGAAPIADAAAASTKRQSRFSRAYENMKKKPGTHIGSFLLLHELTAVLPLFPLYYFFQWTDLAPSLLGGPAVATMAKFTIPDVIPASLGGGRRVEDVMTEWIDTSARTVARVGSKYGIMGFHKVQQLRGKEKEIVEEEGAAAVREGMRGMPNLGIRSKIAESVSGVSVRTVMDAVAAYAVVKALLPVRLAISVAGTPWFASRIVIPCINAIRRKPQGV